MKKITIAVLKQALDDIIADRAQKAAASAYDQSVLICAVSAARDAIEEVAQRGSICAYQDEVLRTLSNLRETYNDSSGEYTNGKAAIGDIYMDVYAIFRNDDMILN